MRKYRNKTKRCTSGHKHLSIWEATVCDYLLSLWKSNRILSYTQQYKIVIDLKGKHICNHIVDFLVKKNKPGSLFVEAKGPETGVFRIKRKMVMALYPKIPYITVHRGELNLIDEALNNGRQ